MNNFRHLFLAGWILSWLACCGIAQQAVPPRGFSFGRTSNAKDEGSVFERDLLALELAKTAAENGSTELSIEAFKRFVDNYSQRATVPVPPTISRSQSLGIQSSLLGTPADDPFSVSPQSGPVLPALVSNDPHELTLKMIEVVQTWNRSNVDAGQVADTLRLAVLPPRDPKIVRMFAGNSRQSGQPLDRTTRTIVSSSGTVTTTTTYSSQATDRTTIANVQRFREPQMNQALGFYLIDWAARAGQLEPLLAELHARSAHAEGGDAHALLIFGYRSIGRPTDAAKYINKLLDENKLFSHQCEMVIQAAMQPMPKDPLESDEFSYLSAASSPIPLKVLERLLESGLRTNLVGTAPYYQHLIRRSIQQEQIKWMNELVPLYVQGIEASVRTSQFARSNVWHEVANECYRMGYPHMALQALRNIEEKPVAPGGPVPSPRYHSRLNALLGLCELPIEKRMAMSQTLILDEMITSSDVFHFSNFPDSPAPIYFHAASWQAAAKLLQAHPSSNTVSLLDLLLTDADTSGKLDETIDKLFERLPQTSLNNSEVARLLCEWIRMRSEVRGAPIPERIVKEHRKLAYDRDFEQWFLKLSPEIRKSLTIHYVKSPDSPAAKFVEMLSSAAPELVSRIEGSAEAASGNKQAPSDSSTGPAGKWTSSDALKHWLRVSVPDPPNSQAFAGHGHPFRAWQLSNEKQLRAPNTSAALLFKYPLQGNYALRTKVTGAGDDWSNHSFGGVINGTFLEYRGRTQSGSRITLASLNGRLTSSLSSSFRMSDNPDITATVDVECNVTDNRVALTINGKKLAHSEFTSQSFPFVGLIPMQLPSLQGSIEITGSPKIATEVNLLDKSFSGWSARRYDRLLTNVIQLRPVEQPPAIENPAPSQLASWKLEENELRSEGSLAAANTNDPQVMVRKAHNCMLYARPLLDGERFEYEVWTDSNTPAAAPVIGLTALLIEAGKVRLHWLPTANEIQTCGITNDNRADDPQAEQLAEAKLNDGQWNNIALRVEGKLTILSINGTDIYRRPIPENNTTEFGWLSIPDQPSIRIRNAKLEGNWPGQMPEDLWEAN